MNNVRSRSIFSRIVTVFSVSAVATAGMVSVATSASAHGSVQDPPSRTYQCRFLDPNNEMCKQAWNANSQSLYDWMEVNQGQANGNHQAVVPDGQLCAAGRDKYSAFNTASDKWPVTHMTTGANGHTTIKWENTAPHETAYNKVYITKPGFDVKAAPLKWSDLQLVGDSGPRPRESFTTIDVTLPNRSERAILYSVWQRSDSPEAFYSCSDVTVNQGTTTSPTPTQTPTSSPTPTQSPTPTPTPTPSATPSPTATPTPTQPAGNGVELDFSTNTEWGSGRTVDATVKNNTGSTSANWEISVPWDGAVNGWNATVSKDGNNLKASNASWNGQLAPGAVASYGFTHTHSAVQHPQTCTAKLNGTAVACSIKGVQATPTSTPSPTQSPTQTPTPSSTPTPSPTATPTSGGQVATQVTVTSDWGSGYCADVKVTTTSASLIDWQAQVPIQKGKLTTLWEAEYQVSGNKITATGKPWNKKVSKTQPATFGFCAG